MKSLLGLFGLAVLSVSCGGNGGALFDDVAGQSSGGSASGATTDGGGGGAPSTGGNAGTGANTSGGTKPDGGSNREKFYFSRLPLPDGFGIGWRDRSISRRSIARTVFL